MEYFKLKNYSKAVKYFKKDVNSKIVDVRSYYYLGICYYNGMGVEQQDYTKAIEYLTKFADEKSDGHKKEKGISCFIMGKMFVQGGKGIEKNYTEAVKWFEKARDYGCDEALTLLGISYYEGKGVKQDYSKAFKLLQKSISNQSPPELLGVSQCLLGECYYYGRGVKLDYFEAINYYRSSAKNGFSYASCALGRCYEKGHGVGKNREEAFRYYKQAADNGIDDAQCWLGNYYRRGTGDEMNPDYEKAFEYYKRAADQNHVEGLEKLAWCYRYGKGVEEDPEKAEELEEKAKKLLAEKGEDK